MSTKERRDVLESEFAQKFGIPLSELSALGDQLSDLFRRDFSNELINRAEEKKSLYEDSEHFERIKAKFRVEDACLLVAARDMILDSPKAN